VKKRPKVIARALLFLCFQKEQFVGVLCLPFFFTPISVQNESLDRLDAFQKFHSLDISRNALGIQVISVIAPFLKNATLGQCLLTLAILKSLLLHKSGLCLFESICQTYY